MIYANSNSYFKIWSLDESEKYTTVRMSTSRKNKMTDEWVNSNWQYVRFVGEAHKKCKMLSEGDKITNVRLSIDNEPYKKDGETVYPKMYKLTVFDFDFVQDYRKPSKSAQVDDADFGEPDGELPF